MAIVGLGLDICSVARIEAVLAGPRGQKFLERVYTQGERALCSARADFASAYAARFAAKEAFVKALGAPAGIRWRDMEVARAGGAPHFILTGVARELMDRRGWTAFLALTHDAGIAAATVVLEANP